MEEFNDKVFNNSKNFLKEFEKNENVIFSKNFYPFIAILVVSIGFSILLFYNFKSNSSKGEIPLIKASTDPIKIKPVDSDGIKIANTDKLVYNNLLNRNFNELPKVERILPLPEKPLEINEIVKKEKIEEKTQINPILEDDVVKDTPLLPIENNKRIDIKKLPETVRSKINNHQIEKISSKKKYKIQLASFKNEREALNQWKKIKHNYSILLSKFEPIIEPKEILGKGRYYRLYLGQFNSESDARILCKKLIKQNQDCLIIKE